MRIDKKRDTGLPIKIGVNNGRDTHIMRYISLSFFLQLSFYYHLFIHLFIYFVLSLNNYLSVLAPNPPTCFYLHIFVAYRFLSL